KEQAHLMDLDSLPEMPYHLVPLEKYWYHGFGEDARFAAVFSSRGCSFKCYYCPYPMGFGGCIVHRDPIKVVDEIEKLQKTYGVEGILFRDQVFSMDWDKTHRLCDEIIRRKLNLKWVVETRLDRVNEELLLKMKAAGCIRIHYGLESGDPKLFSRVGKDGAEGRMEELLANFTLTEKIGIHPHMFMLIGLLGETWDTVNSTIQTIKRMKPVTLQVAVVTPYPGTGLYDEIKEKGLLLSEDWSLYTGFKAVARTEELSSDDLIKARGMVISAYQKAAFWKKRKQLAKLFVKYLFDGSVFRRLARHIRLAILRFNRKLKLTTKLLMCQFINKLGLIWSYRKSYNQKHGTQVRILSAHRVVDENAELSDYDKLDLERGCLSLAAFEERIVYLKKNYNFIRLEDYVGALKDGGSIDENAVVLTFDDGFKDIIDSAYPVLRKYNIPFTIFATTSMVGHDKRMLTDDDIKVLAKDPLVAWGAHTVAHRWLTNMSIEEAESEIVDSKNKVEELTGAEVSLFCYPDGKFNDDIVSLLKKHEFIGACSTGRGMSSGRDGVMGLKRIPFESEPFARFALRMAGWS
ncbi:MAG: polysaccharide deacetylase family protein, partial [Kiritimatiellae bacterium]|nr:polysaccharide deacetylase family protein [Kiritimatiellia bacterium]